MQPVEVQQLFTVFRYDLSRHTFSLRTRKGNVGQAYSLPCKKRRILGTRNDDGLPKTNLSALIFYFNPLKHLVYMHVNITNLSD